MHSRLIWMTCLNKACPLFQKRDGRNMRRYGLYKTKMGKRRRVQCGCCKKTRGTNAGTAYAGLRCSRNRFDLVAKLSVEGVDISAISRIVQVTWPFTTERPMWRGPRPLRSTSTARLTLSGSTGRALLPRLSVILMSAVVRVPSASRGIWRWSRSPSGCERTASGR